MEGSCISIRNAKLARMSTKQRYMLPALRRLLVGRTRQHKYSTVLRFYLTQFSRTHNVPLPSQNPTDHNFSLYRPALPLFSIQLSCKKRKTMELSRRRSSKLPLSWHFSKPWLWFSYQLTKARRTWHLNVPIRPYVARKAVRIQVSSFHSNNFFLETLVLLSNFGSLRVAWSTEGQKSW